MKTIIALSAAALALSACGNAPGEQSLQNTVGAVVDERALAGAVNQSIDREALESIAKGAVAGAVQDAIPAEVRAVGAVIDERALADGIDRAVDGNALGGAVQGVIDGATKPAQK